MDWGNERYVRLYVRDTADMLAAGWEGRAVFTELLRKVDRAGLLDISDREVLADLLRMPREIVDVGLERLLRRGVVLEMAGGGLLVRNFLEAQEARQSDAQRQRESRARRAASAASQGVTGRHGADRVYLAASSGMLKVGISADPERRVEGMRTARPEGVVLLGSVRAAKCDEERILAELAAFRVSGEWFSADALAMAMGILADYPDWRGDDAAIDEFKRVTGCHGGSQGVTAGHSSLAVPCLAVPGSNSVPSREADGAEGGTGAGDAGASRRRAKKPPPEWALEAAGALCSAVRSHWPNEPAAAKVASQERARAAWARELDALARLELVGDPPAPVGAEAVRSAIAWLAEHGGRRYVPEVRSAGALRKKWGAVQAAISRGAATVRDLRGSEQIRAAWDRAEENEAQARALRVLGGET